MSARDLLLVATGRLRDCCHGAELGAAPRDGRQVLVAGLRDDGARRAERTSTSSSRPAGSSCSQSGKIAGDAVPRHPLARQERRRAGAALGRVRPDVHDEPPLLRRLHRPERRHARRARTARTARRASRRRAKQLAVRQGLRVEPQRRPAPVRPGRLPLLGERRRRRRRRPAAQRPEPRAAVREDHAPERRARRSRAGSSSRTACATRGGSRSTARTATSTSATSARATWEEIDYLKRGRGDRELRLEPLRGQRTSTTARRRCCARRVPRRRSSSTRTRRAARSPAATSTAARRCAAAAGRYFYGDYCSGHGLEPAVVGGKATASAREPFNVDGAVLVRRGRRRRALPDVGQLGRALRLAG